MHQISIIHRITKILVDVLFYTGIICVFLVPFSGSLIGGYYGYAGYTLLLLLIILFLSGIGSVYILFNLRRMFQTLLGGNPFSEKNVSCFRKMAVSCAGIAVLFVIKCAALFSWGTLVVAIVFAIGTLFCLTLKDVFQQAAYYKEEHDWTV